MKKISDKTVETAIINGPNLDMLGRREPEIYGNVTFEEYLDELRRMFPDMEIHFFQSNSEGELIDAIHRIGTDPAIAGVVINPGAYAHYSYAIADAIRSVTAPFVEVHISNIFAREEFRRQSVTAPACRGAVTGLGLDGYRLALLSLIETTKKR